MWNVEEGISLLGSTCCATAAKQGQKPRRLNGLKLWKKQVNLISSIMMEDRSGKRKFSPTDASSQAGNLLQPLE